MRGGKGSKGKEEGRKREGIGREGWRVEMEGLEKRREVGIGASRKGGGGEGNNDIKEKQKISRIKFLWNRGQNRGLF